MVLSIPSRRLCAAPSMLTILPCTSLELNFLVWNVNFRLPSIGFPPGALRVALHSPRRKLQPCFSGKILVVGVAYNCLQCYASMAPLSVWSRGCGSWVCCSMSASRTFLILLSSLTPPHLQDLGCGQKNHAPPLH